MKLNKIQLAMAIDAASPDATTRSRVTSYALAVALQSVAPEMPSSQVQFAGEHFDGKVREKYNTFIYAINECVILNVDLAASMARKVWMFKYGVLYTPVLSWDKTGSFFEDLFCTSLYFSPDEVKFFNDNKSAILAATSILAAQLREGC
jgi:hypothetical protein